MKDSPRCPSPKDPINAMRPVVRVLLGATGWPSGVLEIASWAHRQGLAEVRVVEVPSEANDATPALSPGDSPIARAEATLGPRFSHQLRALRPHLVGFRIEGGQFSQVRARVAAVRALSAATVVLGGPTATSHPREVLEDCDADYVFSGEAEEPFHAFLQRALQTNSIDLAAEIPGLAYRYGGRALVNTLPTDGYQRSILESDPAACHDRRRCLQDRLRPTAPVEVLAANRLDWGLVEPMDRSFESLFFTGGRGCPGSCSFCSRLHGQEVRVKEAGQLLEEIEAADAQVAAGRIRLGRYRLFQHVADPAMRDRQVAWVSIFDEDFFLHRRRAIDFFRLWGQSPLREKYRLSVQTNPCSLLTGQRADEELLAWLDRLKPMVQLGAESFHPQVLGRWQKRHTVEQLEIALAALDTTGQDYSAFQLLTDFESTPEELIDSLRLLALGACRHRRMRIAASPYTIPLYDSAVRKRLEFRTGWDARRVRHFTDYESPQPGWMDPLTADLADVADSQLQFALELEHRDGALLAALEGILAHLVAQRPPPAHLVDQAHSALDALREAQFRAIGP